MSKLSDIETHLALLRETESVTDKLHQMYDTSFVLFAAHVDLDLTYDPAGLPKNDFGNFVREVFKIAPIDAAGFHNLAQRFPDRVEDKNLLFAECDNFVSQLEAAREKLL